MFFPATIVHRSLHRVCRVLALGAAFSMLGCGPTGADGENKPVETGDKITASVVNACPNSDNLTATTSWMQCLAGKSARGTDPGDPSKACEVRFKPDQLAEFTYGGNTFATHSPARWESGLYQNHKLGAQRQLLGSLTSDTLVVDAIHGIDVHIVTGDFDDVVEIEMFDASLKRIKLTCKLDGI